MPQLTELSAEQQEFERLCQEEKRLHDQYRQQVEELRGLNEEMPRVYRRWQEMLESRALHLKTFPFLKG